MNINYNCHNSSTHHSRYRDLGTYKIDGVYHKWARIAVKQFQKAKKLKVTGKVDYETAKTLRII